MSWKTATEIRIRDNDIPEPTMTKRKKATAQGPTFNLSSSLF